MHSVLLLLFLIGHVSGFCLHTLAMPDTKDRARLAFVFLRLTEVRTYNQQCIHKITREYPGILFSKDFDTWWENASTVRDEWTNMNTTRLLLKRDGDGKMFYEHETKHPRLRAFLALHTLIATEKQLVSYPSLLVDEAAVSAIIAEYPGTMYIPLASFEAWWQYILSAYFFQGHGFRGQP